jgi:hypothetical protein
VLPVLRHDLQQLVLQPGAGQRVQRAEGLVHQQHLGLHRQRAGDAHALLHAAADLVRALVRRGQAHQVQRGQRALLQLRLALGGAEHPLHRQVDVVQAAQPGQQRVVLEHHAAVGAGARRSRGRRSSSTPVVGVVSPATRFSSVLLPQPEWPISVTNSPLATSG